MFEAIFHSSDKHSNTFSANHKTTNEEVDSHAVCTDMYIAGFGALFSS